MIEYDIWEHVPDFTTTPKEARVGNPDVIAIAPAGEFVSFPEARVERILVFGFAWDVVRDWTLAKQFWAEKGGRAEVFLLPSWQRDLTPVAMPTLGSYTITVDHPDYAAAYLTTTNRDEIGRYIYVWDQTGGLQVLKVMSAEVVAEGSTLTLEDPFDFTPKFEAFVGFALLVRFDDDESEWVSHDPTHVRAQLTFRTTREAINTPATGALVSGLEQYQSLPFTAFEQTVEDTPLRFDVSEVLGPTNYRISQNATYDVLWAAWPSSGGIRLLKNATPGDIIPPDESVGILSSYFSSAIDTDHIALAFDQTGYEVFAFHVGSQIRVKSFVADVTFDGFAPSLFYNGQVNIQARIDGLTDVVCYYLKRGSSGLFARFQRDNFATEYLLGGYPTRPFYLLTAHSVDGLVHSMTAIDEGYRKMRLDATYPAQPEPLPDPYVSLVFTDAVAVNGELTDLQDEYAIISAMISDAAGVEASLSEIESENVAPPPTNFTEEQGSAGSIADIMYEVVITSRALTPEAAGSLASIADITYVNLVPPTTPQSAEAASQGSISEIYYGP